MKSITTRAMPLLASATLLLLFIPFAQAHYANLTLYGLPSGTQFLYRVAPNYTTQTFTSTGYTSVIPIYISNSTYATYGNAIPYQEMNAGTAVVSNGVTYQMLTSTYTETLSPNKQNYLSYYVYLNSTLWNTNESAELKASNVSLNTAKIVIAGIDNITQNLPYGQVTNSSLFLAAGSVKKNASYVDNIVKFTKTNVTKASPVLKLKIGNDTFTQQQPIIYLVPPGVTSVPVQISSSVLNHINYTFTSNVNNVNSTQKYLNTNDINQSFDVHPGIFSFDTTGNKNYTTVDPTGIIITIGAVSGSGYPSGTSYASTITLQNKQNVPTSSDFVEQLFIDPNSINSYLASNLMNIEFSYQPSSTTNTVLYSWLEGETSNQLVTQLNTATNVSYWVSTNGLPGNDIPASNSVNIQLDIGSTSTDFMNGINTGEAPQLQCTNPSNTPSCTNYGKLDNGNVIFPAYDNFEGTSLSPKWNVNAYNGVTASNSYTVANGLQAFIYNESITYNGVGTSEYSNTNYQISFLVNVQMTLGAGYYAHQPIDFVGTANVFNLYEDAGITTANGIYYGVGQQNGYFLSTYNTGTGTLSSTGVPLGAPFAVTASSNTIDSILQINYTRYSTSSTDNVIVGYPIIYGGTGGTGSTGKKGSLNVTWMRITAVPPNDIPLTISSSSPYTPPSTPTLSSCPSSAKLDVGQTVSCTANVIGGTSPYSYNWLISNSITNAITSNMLFTGVSATSNTFTYTATSADAANSPLQFNSVVTDAHPTTVNSVYSSTISVAPALTDSWSDSNAIVDIGQYQTLTASTDGTGTSPYSYNWYVVNSATNALVTNTLYTGLTATSNTITFTSSWSGGTGTSPYSYNYLVYNAEFTVTRSVPDVTVTGVVALSVTS